VDGGQSSTTALIGDADGRVLGMGRSGPCNHVKTGDGRAKFLNAVGGSIGAALEQAGLGSVSFAGACLGFSGGPADKEALVGELVRADRVVVTHDALIALTGATAGEPGIITIAGTGSISFGRNSEGRIARAGGWGYVFGDEGGGFDLTRQALRAALREHEGWGPKTALTPMLLEATGSRDANELMHRFYTSEFTRPQIAAMSKLVDQAAEAGDGVARELLLCSAQELALYTAAVRSQLFAEREAAQVSPIGGVYRSRILVEQFRSLVEKTEGNRFAMPVYGPAAGALLEAYRLAGVKVILKGVPAEK
jgi:N-acetylglucosamine kinase-like BadF-type ATPase